MIEVDLFARMPAAQIAVVTVKEVLIDRNIIFQSQAVETIMRVGKVDTAIDLSPIPVCFLIAFRIIDFSNIIGVGTKETAYLFFVILHVRMIKENKRTALFAVVAM